MMSMSAKVLRNSLMFLTLAAAVPLASAADGATAAAKFSVPTQSAKQPPTPRLLNLKAPDIHEVMTPGEIAAAIPNLQDVEIEPEIVQVRSEVPAPYVPGGFAALYWAALHPAESWRILAPVQ
jgi:hypothetical protein